jgi:hypothetical protein
VSENDLHDWAMYRARVGSVRRSDPSTAGNTDVYAAPSMLGSVLENGVANHEPLLEFSRPQPVAIRAG